MPQQITRVQLYYDSLSRVIEDSQEFEGDTRNATNEKFTSYPVTQQAFPDGRQISQQHDPLYRRTLVEETAGGADIAAWDYFGPTRVAEVTLANGLVCSHLNNDRTHSAVQESIPNPAWGDQSSDRLGYDGAGRMITKRYLAGGINGTTGAYNDPTAIVGQTTAYDKASNKFYERTLQAESRSSLYEPFDADNRPAGGYDSLDRLRQYQRGVLSSSGGCGNAGGGSVTTPISLPGTDENRDYDLDGLGNWKKTTFEPVGEDEQTQIRQHNSLNQITSLKDEGQPKDDLSYDLNGNLLDDGTRTYQWDALNRLKVVKRKSDGLTIGEYLYDAMNRRVEKIISNGGLSGTIPNGTTRFLYHSNTAQCCEERDGSNSVTKQYVWGRYIDELIQQKQAVTINGNAAGNYYPLSDTLYRTIALTDSSGFIVEAYDTDVYGNTLIFTAAGTGGEWWADDVVTGNNPTCDFIFTGRRYDSESAIYFYRGRQYVPSLGRFETRDPMLLPAVTHVYQYARSGPQRFVDPHGNTESDATCGADPLDEKCCDETGDWGEGVGKWSERYDDAMDKVMSCPEAAAVWTELRKLFPNMLKLSCTENEKETPSARVKYTAEGGKITGAAIVINCRYNATTDSIARAIFFEMLNAKRKDEFAAVIKDIRTYKDREAFGKAYETVEYGSVKEHYEISKKCIESGKWGGEMDRYSVNFEAEGGYDLKKYLEDANAIGHTESYRQAYDKRTQTKP